VVCSFLEAAVPVNPVRTVMEGGICLIKDGDQVLCRARFDQARQLLISLPPCFGEIANPERDNSDANGEQAYLEECAGILDNLNLADDKDTFQIH
jgi:hypothetical protein